jgi:hypothetical protein
LTAFAKAVAVEAKVSKNRGRTNNFRTN